MVVNSKCSAPVVSIVMSVKNGMPFLPETVESILAQTECNWELVAVDNVSDDGSVAYLESVAAQDPRIRVLKNDEDLGMSGGLNRGLAESTAEWVVRMDADDIMLPNRIERQLAFIAENPDVRVSCCRGMYVNEHGEVALQTTASDLLTREKFHWYVETNEAIGLLHPGVIMHRQTVLDAGGYRKPFWPAEDIDLWNRLAEQGHVILVQDEVLLQYRLHSRSSITSGFKRGRQQYEWVRECMVARRQGQPEPTFDEFMARRQAEPILKKIDRWRKLNAKCYYREAGQARLAKNWPLFLLKLGCSAVLQPNYFGNRMQQQVFRR